MGGGETSCCQRAWERGKRKGEVVEGLSGAGRGLGEGGAVGKMARR